MLLKLDVHILAENIRLRYLPD